MLTWDRRPYTWTWRRQHHTPQWIALRRNSPTLPRTSRTWRAKHFLTLVLISTSSFRQIPSIENKRMWHWRKKNLRGIGCSNWSPWRFLLDFRLNRPCAVETRFTRFVEFMPFWVPLLSTEILLLVILIFQLTPLGSTTKAALSECLIGRHFLSSRFANHNQKRSANVPVRF